LPSKLAGRDSSGKRSAILLATAGFNAVIFTGLEPDLRAF
jgi:hypothetical protein